MISKEDEVILKEKQKEFNLSNEQCNKVIEYIKFGFTFTDAELYFEEFIFDYISKKK